MAYSSVTRIALVLLGIVVNTSVALAGVVTIIVAHGLCSSGLLN